MATVAPWSYSSLTAFEQCPRRYKLTRIDKTVSEPPTTATTHGNEVHKALELAVRDTTALPDKFKQYTPLVEMVRNSPGVKKTETKFGLTRSFTPTDFWAKDVWVRGVLDLAILQSESAIVLDWKTGKPKVDSDQLKLFAAATLALYPRISTVKTGYAWLTHNRLDTETHHRGDEVEIWKQFIPRVQRVDEALSSGKYPPKPSGLCRAWCPVPRSMCEFSGKA